MITINLPDGRSINIDTDDKDVALSAAKKYISKNPVTERGAELGEEDVSTLGDIARGVGAGLVGTVEGIASLPAELADLVTDPEESNAEAVREFFGQYKPTTSTTLGEAAKFITQFAVPGGLAAKAAKAAQLGRAGQIGSFAAADVAATTPDVETLGDFFDGGPTKRLDASELVGAERAAAELSNRLKVAAEGATLLLGVPAAVKVAAPAIGRGVDAVASTDVVKRTAQAIKNPDSVLTNVGVKADVDDPTFLQQNIAKVSKKAKKYLTFQGEMPDVFSRQLQALRVQQVSAQNQRARQSMEEVDNALKALKKSGNLNETDERLTLNALNNYMFAEEVGVPGTNGFKPRSVVKEEGRQALVALDEKLKAGKSKSLFGGRRDLSLLNAADKFRNQIDKLSDTIRDDTFLSKEMSDELTTAIGDNKGYYATRMYRSLKDSNAYVPTEPQVRSALDEIMKISDAVNPGQGISEEAALGILNDLRQRVSFNNASMKPADQFAESTLSGVAQGIMKGRRLDDLPAVRDFLGEYSGASDVLARVKKKDGTFGVEPIRQRSLEEQRLGLRTKAIDTIDGMAKAITKSKYFDNLNVYNSTLPEANRFIFDEVPKNITFQEAENYVRVGMEGASTATEVSDIARKKYGPLAGKYVKEEYLRAIEDMPQQFLSADTNRLWATFLAAKGFSQVAKTVLSPITQIRNATTASFFALKNGNFGNAENLIDSAQTVFSQIGQRLVDLPGSSASGALAAKIDRSGSLVKRNADDTVNIKKGDIDNYYDDLIELGIVNTNAKIGEFENLFKDALSAKQGVFGKKYVEKAANIQNTFAGKLYQGSDDIWKIYSYEMELGRLMDAFKKGAKNIPVTDVQNQLMLRGRSISELSGPELQQLLKREAASIVKDTVPNYARVPQAIQQLRRLPFGNFVAFPAEIIRTSASVYGRAMKELGNESVAIRSIGMRRLLGSLTVDGGLYGGLMAGGLALTGSNMEQVNAFKRSFAADWEKNAMLIPLATDKDGNITDFYNFSYTNPYDYLTRSGRAIFNAVNSGITGEKELNAIAFDAAMESGREFFSPFLGESILTEKILDVGRNQTRFGRSVYNNEDPFDVKIGKSFAHLAEGLTPGASPIELTSTVTSSLPGGLDIRVGDFPKALGLAAGITDPREAVKRSGVRIDPAGEFVEALTGIKAVKPKIETSLLYRGYEAGRAVRDASGIFNQIAKTSGNVSAEDMTKAYITANDQRFKALRDLNMAIEDARTLGLSTSEIMKPLKKAKVPQLNAVMAGRFNAFTPSRETIRFALQGNENKLSNPFDFEAMAEVRKSFQGSAFRPQAKAEQMAAQEAAQTPIAPPPTQPQPAPQIAPTQPSTAPTSLFNRGTDALRQVELNKLLGID